MRLFLEKIRLALLKRSGKAANKKNHATWAAKGYNNAPRISFVFQTHNKSVAMEHLVPKLRKVANAEIIVIDDGSDIDHTARLARLLTGANEFLFRANDLYENVTYDRCLRLANGDFVALLQDDDDFDTLQWVDDAVRHFDAHPKMVILGGKNALEMHFDDAAKMFDSRAVAVEAGTDFCYAMAVNRAPMWVRRSLFLEHLKHIDFRLAPFQFDDDELCARAWMQGLQVGWYDAQFKSLTAGGMRLWNRAFTQEQMARNGRLLYERCASERDAIAQKVAEAQNTLL